MIDWFGLYLMSACSVHIHRNKAVLLLFGLCFLSLFLLSSLLHHLLCHLNPQKQQCIPISCFSILLTSSLCSFVHPHEYASCKVILYVIVALFFLPLLLFPFKVVIFGVLFFFLLLLFGGVIELTSFGGTGVGFLEIISFTGSPFFADAYGFS